MYDYEQNDNSIENLYVLFMFLAIAISGGWMFYFSKIKGKNLQIIAIKNNHYF